MRFPLLSIFALSFSGYALSNTFDISNLEPYETWLEVQFSDVSSTENIRSEYLYGRSSIYQAPSDGIDYDFVNQTNKENQSTQQITLATAFPKRKKSTVTPIIGLNYEKVETSSKNSLTNFKEHFYTTKLFLGADYKLDSDHSLTGLYAYQYSSESLFRRDESSLELSINSEGVTTPFSNQISLLALRNHNSNFHTGGHKLTLRNTMLYRFNNLLKFDFMLGVSYISEEKNGSFLNFINAPILTGESLESNSENASESGDYAELFNDTSSSSSLFNQYIEYDYQLAYGASAYFNPTQSVSIKFSAIQNRTEGTISDQHRFDETNTLLGLSLITRF